MKPSELIMLLILPVTILILGVVNLYYIKPSVENFEKRIVEIKKSVSDTKIKIADIKSLEKWKSRSFTQEDVEILLGLSDHLMGDELALFTSFSEFSEKITNTFNKSNFYIVFFSFLNIIVIIVLTKKIEKRIKT